jgi:hypothetical protein
MPHIIRLRGAWECTSSAGITSHSRNFGRPRTLEFDERVWLICRSVPGRVDVFLNAVKVGENRDIGSLAIDITERLQPRNTIRFEVAANDPLGEVVIEIRASK